METSWKSPSVGNPLASETRAALERHAARRRQGVPTVSVLVGPFGSAISLWRAHLELTGQRLLLSHGAPTFPLGSDTRNEPSPMVATASAYGAAIDVDWLRELECRWQLKEVVAAAWKVAAGGTTSALPGELRDKSLWEVELLLENSLPDDPAPSAAWLCRVLAPRLIDPTLARHWTSSSSSADQLFRRMLVRALAQVLPPTAMAGLLLFCPLPEREREWFDAGAREAVRWAIDAPNLPIALRVSSSVWNDFAQGCGHDRTVSVLREGVVSLDGAASGAGSLAASACDRGASHVALQLPIPDVLARDGGSSKSLELYRQLVAAAERSLESPEASDRARSAAERFLFDRLENHPLFAGQFELNGRLEASTELDQTWEIDLLARRRRLAVEIDGYYHFQNSEAYRRDRRKDCSLQLAGFVVLRFLAEDVVQNLEEILRTIERAFRTLPSWTAPGSSA